MSLRKVFKSGVWLFFLSVTFIASCDSNDPCSEIHSDAYTKSFIFQIVDQTGSTLIGVTGTRYESDDVTVQNEDGSEPNLLSIGDAGSISYLLADQSEPFNQKIDKTFYLILPPTSQFPEIDIDTINISYLISDSNECDNPRIEDIQIQYNDSLYITDILTSRYNFLKL